MITKKEQGKNREKLTLEVLAEQTIFAYNNASFTLFQMLKNNNFDFQKSDFVVKEANRKHTAFKRGCFGKNSKFSIEQRVLAGNLLGEINTAITTYNQVLDKWNLKQSKQIKNEN